MIRSREVCPPIIAIRLKYLAKVHGLNFALLRPAHIVYKAVEKIFLVAFFSMRMAALSFSRLVGKTLHPRITPVHCLTFDIEEHFQVSRFDSPIRRRHWGSFESRVTPNTCKVLDLLARYQTRATFFVLGWVAERHPGLIKQIAECGHEIASHGYGHELVTAQTPELFRADVRKAKQILEDLTGSPVQGYRAPGFTITRETLWALPILAEEGHTYDSSVVPIRHDHCGVPGSDPWHHLKQTSSGPIWELPPSTVNLGGVRLPIAGGSYFRLLPFPGALRIVATD